MSISRKPKAARTITGGESWWYDDAQCIHVYIQSADGRIFNCTIKRSALLKYIKRTAQ